MSSPYFQGFQNLADNVFIKGDVMDFCSHGIDITDDGISRNYTSADGISGVSITSTYAVNESCPAGGKTSWEEARCKFLLNRPLGECTPIDKGLSDSVDLYGMSSCDFLDNVFRN